jgi:hypothetical protein
MLAARRERGAALLASPGISHWVMLRVTRARAGRGGVETAVSVSQVCRLRTVGTCLPVSPQRAFAVGSSPDFSVAAQHGCMCPYHWPAGAARQEDSGNRARGVPGP